MNIDKPISNARAITGYSPLSVVEHIKELQQRCQKEISRLKEQLKIEQEMNEKLKLEVEKLQTLPQNKAIEEEMKDMLGELFEQHLQNTHSILDLQNKLKQQEAELLYELETKKQQRAMVKNQLKGSLEYFKARPSLPSELGKGMV